MKTIQGFLSQPMASIVEKTQHLQRLNLHWQSLPFEIVKYGQIAGLEKNILTIITETNAWATRIRFQAPEILKALNHINEFNKITTLVCKIAPPKIFQQPARIVKKRHMSQETVTLIQEIAKGITSRNLQESLLRLCNSLGVDGNHCIIDSGEHDR